MTFKSTLNMITTEKKQQIIEALKGKRDNFFGTDAKFAVSIGINGAQYSRIKNGETEKVLSDSSWITLARLCNIEFSNTLKWVTAETPIFTYITAQLDFCQKHSASRILCDVADIGKTHTGKVYAAKNVNAIHVDCSQVKTKQKLIRHIAKEYGVGYTGKYADVYADLVFYLRTLVDHPPLIILDEVGDLSYEAFLELKALWNALEGLCGWYMMGADGLKQKITNNITSKKVGYTEIFSRYGNKYQRKTPEGEHELKEFKMTLAALIIKLNFPEDTDISRTMAKADFTLRNLKDERKKLSA